MQAGAEVKDATRSANCCLQVRCPIRFPSQAHRKSTPSPRLLLGWQKMLPLPPKGRREVGKETPFKGSTSTGNRLLLPDLEEEPAENDSLVDY